MPARPDGGRGGRAGADLTAALPTVHREAGGVRGRKPRGLPPYPFSTGGGGRIGAARDVDDARLLTLPEI